MLLDSSSRPGSDSTGEELNQIVLSDEILKQNGGEL